MKALTENGHVSLTNKLVHMCTESCKARAECGWLTVRQEGSHLQRITARSWYKRKYLQWYTSWIPRYWHPGTHASRFEKTYPIYCHYLVMMQMRNRTTTSLSEDFNVRPVVLPTFTDVSNLQNSMTMQNHLNSMDGANVSVWTC